MVGFVVMTRHGYSRQHAGRGRADRFQAQHGTSPLSYRHILSMSTEESSAQVQPPKHGLRDRIKRLFMSGDNAARIRKRRKAAAVAWRYVNVLRCVNACLTSLRLFTKL
jgi:hypothetical protein